jgi:hypothetical protein
MAVDVSENLRLSADLAEWYWRFGVYRQAKYPLYAISTSEWLNKLYGIKKELAVVDEAGLAGKPCCAVWGPSQTGKSTLVSAYLDEKAKVNGEGTVPMVYGEGAALHWPGGEPALFMNPAATGNKLPAPGVKVLNPFNNGKDASACVSRFVLGSLQEGTRDYYVADPRFPMEIRVGGQTDLLEAIARGFDNWCWGHSPTGGSRAWNVDMFQDEIQSYEAPSEGGGQEVLVDRRAYELLHDFCHVLSALVQAGLTRYKELAAEEQKFRSAIASLLAEKALISNFKMAEQLVASVLWDNCEDMTREYREMRDALEQYEERFAGKTLHCDIQTAMLLVDMDVYDLLTERNASPTAATGRQDPQTVRKLVLGLGTRTEGTRLFLGQFPENRLFTRPDPAKEFAIFQGLVFELVVPLNPANLADTPFLKYLKDADLLDFPGVSNNPPNASTKVECACRHRQPAASLADLGAQELEPRPKFDTSIFFSRILKDGRTSSIVSTYARRLGVDGFVIFQNLDGQPAAQAEQLQTGIKSWWRAMTPEYFKEPGNKGSPLPLNLGLLWWTKVFNEADQNKPRFNAYARIYRNLGPLSDPKIITGTFALNYYHLARGQAVRSPEILKALAQSLLQDEEFKQQFCNPESRQSFEKMMQDRVTGGANFFFEQLDAQFGNLWQRPDVSRGAILEKKSEQNHDLIQRLLDWNNLFPPPEKRDIRKEHLEKFRDFLSAKVERLDEPQMRRLNYALRVFLDVQQDDLSPVPVSLYDVTPQYIQDQYQRWCSCQLDRFRKTSASTSAGAVDWNLIGIPNEAVCRDYLTALVNSVLPERIKKMAGWLAELVEFGASSRERVDARPYLATRMANEIAYGPDGIPSEGVMPADETVVMNSDGSERVPPSGTNCPSYRIVVADFLERRLPQLIKMNIEVTAVVGLPGVKELEDLCQKYNRTPQILADAQTE